MSDNSGFRQYLLSIYPTLAPAMGPSKGMPDMESAADAPIIAMTSVCISGSMLNNVAIT